jgi:hypothetical protein
MGLAIKIRKQWKQEATKPQKTYVAPFESQIQ